MITGARGAVDIEQPVTGIQAGAMKSQYEPLCDEVFDASVEAPPKQVSRVVNKGCCQRSGRSSFREINRPVRNGTQSGV